MHRERMKTIPGMSVRAEIDARLEAARLDGLVEAYDDAIAFLKARGHDAAAEDLDRATRRQAVAA